MSQTWYWSASWWGHGPSVLMAGASLLVGGLELRGYWAGASPLVDGAMFLG